MKNMIRTIIKNIMKSKKFAKRVIAVVLVAAAFSAMMPTTVKAEDTSLINSAFLNDINALRASQGLPALTLDASLSSVAAIRAQEASTTWSHTRPNGTQGISLLPSNKWRGENLAYVQYGSFTFTPAEQQAAEALMFQNLKASPTHYNNMVYGSFTKIGICTYVMQVGSGYKLTSAFMFTS